MPKFFRATPPPKTEFTELAEQPTHTVTSVDTWEDWDVSGIVPEGTKAVLVKIYNGGAAQETVGARNNGSALGRYWYQESTMFTHIWTQCDSNRIIEIYSSNDTDVKFGIFGYLK